jgi:hypothetical protein
MNDIDAIVDEMDDEPHSPEYEGALRFHKMGFNVVPIRYQTKIPSVAWGQFQTQRISRTQLARWINKFASGVGVIAGASSNIVVIDTDGAEGEAVLCDWGAAHGPLPTTLTIRSGSGRGVHRYFQHPGGGQWVKSVSYSSIKLDIKGDGGIVVLPPTLHKSGARYTVEIAAPIAALSVGLIEYIEQRAGKPSRTKPSVANNNVQRCVSLNKHNIRVVLSMLSVLPDAMAADYATWLRVGFALHAFDSGKVGLALWKKFSMRCPAKAAVTDFDAKWAGFGQPRQGRPSIGIGTLWKLAEDHGWRPVHFTVTL